MTKRIRKYSRVPLCENYDFDKHDPAFEAAANHWGGFYAHDVDPDILKAIGFEESTLGYGDDAIDIMTVGNNDDFIIPQLKGLTSGTKLDHTTATWTRQFEFLADASVRYFDYQDAAEAPAPAAIKWATCWLYHKAQISNLAENNPPTYAEFGGWRTWEKSVENYGPNDAYLGRVEGPWKRGIQASPNLYLWPVLTNQKARK